MRKVSTPLLTVLAISLFVSLGFVQSTQALPEEIPEESGWKSFWFNVNMREENYAYTWSNLEWMEEWNVHPIRWWPDIPFGPERPPVEEDWRDGLFYCHGDWCMVCDLAEYDGIFRYRWWIFWDDDPYINPLAKCVGGCFKFSHGTDDFKFMHAFGEAWVEWEIEDSVRVLIAQHHEGWIRGAPEQKIKSLHMSPPFL